MTEKDPLVVIDMKNWKGLRDELEKDWPKSVIVYQWIITRLQWEEKEPGKHPFFVCCPEGNVKNGFVAFGKVNGFLAYSTVYTFDDKNDKLQSAIRNTKRIEWHEKPIWGIPENEYQWFADILREKGYPSHDSFYTPYYLFEKSLTSFDINCPEDVYISLLKEDDIPIMNSHWPHNYDNSEEYLKSLFKLNYGYGIYSKADDELLSWALKYEYGDIGVLQTKKEHKRKGYGQLIIKTIVQKMLNDDENVHVHVIEGNVASENLFKGLGFVPVGDFRWIEY